MSPPDSAVTSERLDRLQRVALVVGSAGTLVAVAGSFLGVTRFFRGYLVGWLFCLGVALGSMALLMLYHLVGGVWGYGVRRFLEASTRTLPLLALLFLPLAFGIERLYPWSVAERGELGAKAIYLNVPFFLVRSAFYFSVWIGLSALLCRLSRQQDESADPRIAVRLRQVSGPGLVLWAVTMTFAGWDWMMSIEPAWWSTIYGMTVLVGQGLSALALMILLARGFGNEEPLSRVARVPVFHDLGNLLLALVMVTAYLGFSQFLIVWSGNLTEEIVWYIPRVRTGWGWLASALLLFYFFVPFAMLLSRRAKRRPGILAGIAAGLLVMRLVELVWMIEPAYAPGGLSLHPMDVLLPVGLGGLWLARLASRVRAAPLLPLHDTRVEGVSSHG